MILDITSVILLWTVSKNVLAHAEVIYSLRYSKQRSNDQDTTRSSFEKSSPTL